MAAVILMLMLVGAGSKAGLAPLHVWLPLAHPAAPSHVSALMSGVMTRSLSTGSSAWSSICSASPIGRAPWSSCSAPLQRCWAFCSSRRWTATPSACSPIPRSRTSASSSPLGLALAFRASGTPALAALAFSAGLFHVFNHMLFKSLLFMGAGAVLAATGRRDLDGLGGLIHRMPATAFLALIGVTARLGAAALNGFASEWLLFEAVLQSPELPQLPLQLLVPAAGGMLARRPRWPPPVSCASCRVASAAGHGPRRRPKPSKSTIFPGCDGGAGCAHRSCRHSAGAVLDLLGPAVSAMLDGRLPRQIGQPWLTLVPIAESRSTYGLWS